MKKLVFSILGLYTIAGAMASPEKPANLETAISKKASKPSVDRIITNDKVSKPVVTRTGENTYEFGYCAGIGTALGYPSGQVLEAAIEIPTYMAKGWEGMEITKVYIGFGYSVNKDIYLYVTGDLEGEPDYMQEATLKYDAITFNALGQGEITQTWNEVELTTPYKIDGNPFYLGYQVMCTSAPCYPIGFDNIYTADQLGDILGAPDGPNGEMVYYNLGEYYGSVSLRFEMQGEMKADLDANVGTLFLDNNVISKDDEFLSAFTLLNIGANDITDLDVSCTIGGKEVKDLNVTLYGAEAEGPIPFGVLGFVEVKGKPGDITGIDLPLEVTINNLVGKNGSVPYGYTLPAIPITVLTKTFPKNFIVEEFTGTWCSWCPRGLVGMEYMQENYMDKGFIGIGVHANTSLGTDPMAAESYQAMADWYSEGSYPSAVLNRDAYFDPSVSTLTSYFQQMEGMGTLAKVDVEAQYKEDENVIYATATTEFADNSSDANYALAFVLTQDNVGPYYQQNAFAGGANGEMGGWESKGRRVETMYNMVARYIDSEFGIEGSVPSKVEADKKYDYSVTMAVDEIEKQTSDFIPVNINDCYVIALLIDENSGVIVNGAQVSLKGQAGVEGILADPENGLYQVYNPQGIKVLETKESSDLNNLPKGIYIINGKKIAL